MPNADTHPFVIASVKAAIRAATEGADPVPDYDGLELPGVPGHAYDGDIPLDSEVNVALNSGLTPVTTVDGSARVVRSITSYCQIDANTPDDRTLDIGDAVMTDYGTLDAKLLYDTQFRPANKYVGPDPAEGEDFPPAGVGTPSLWNSSLTHRMEEWWKKGWIYPPSANPPISQFNEEAQAIESIMPLLVRRVQHQLRQIVRQTAP
jgi:phage tail sheath gpL-like